MPTFSQNILLLHRIIKKVISYKSITKTIIFYCKRNEWYPQCTIIASFLISRNPTTYNIIALIQCVSETCLENPVKLTP